MHRPVFVPCTYAGRPAVLDTVSRVFYTCATHTRARMRAVHDRINATRATTTTPHGRRWMRIMNRLRTRLAYALPRYGFAHG